MPLPRTESYNELVADGLVARAAGRLTGVARGLDPKAVSAPEVGFAELDAEYARLITRTLEP